jgi:diguanylate cyclase (GGDEF)-like protein/PAS domain S-box-containing protein
MSAYVTKTLRHFALLFVPLVLVVLAGSAAYVRISGLATVEAVKAREAARVNRETQVMITAFAARAADAAFLAARVAEELAQQSPDSRERIAKLLQSFAVVKKAFLQVRFLDARGHEAVRINRGPQGAVRVPDGELQDKSGTVYFRDGAALSPGHVFVSRFDLNVEQGKIEEPFVPVLRFGSPVAGPDGGFAGLVVLNLDGQVPLDRLRRAAVAALGRPLLANDRGYWLLGPQEDQEWGFQVPGRNGRTLDAAWPGAWKTIQSGERGQFLQDGALYTFDTVQADSQGGMQSATVMHASENWKIVARVPPERLVPPLNATFMLMTGGLLVLLGVLSWLWASGRARRDMIQAELAASEAQFRAMSEATQDALIMTDDHGRVAFLNRAAEQMFGLSREKMAGGLLHEYVTLPDDLAKAREGLPAFTQTGRGKVVDALLEYVARRGDGTTFPVELSVAAFRRDDRWWAVGTARDISERKRAEEALRELATTDGLTGLLNRRRFLELGASELERADRFGHPASLVMFDVDHFKKVNDTRGHDAGDAVLVALARTAGDSLRAVDILGRIGGEEFAVVLPETGLDAAADVAERLRAAVAGMELSPGGAPLPVTISLGAVQSQGPAEGLDGLLKRADAALYRAKAAGRNRVERG